MRCGSRVPGESLGTVGTRTPGPGTGFSEQVCAEKLEPLNREPLEGWEWVSLVFAIPVLRTGPTMADKGAEHCQELYLLEGAPDLGRPR